jgi:O-antigen/teichoic acid export membrane protein
MARELGPGAFGQFSVSLSSGYLVSGLLGFGAATRVLRLAAETNGRVLASGLFVLRMFGGVMAAVISVSLSPNMLGSCAAAMVLADAGMDFEQARRSAVGEHLAAGGLVVLQRLLPGIAALGFFIEGRVGGWGMVIACVLVASVAVAGSLKRFTWPGRQLATVAKSSGGYWLSALASNFNQLELIVLSMVVSVGVLGNYSAAARLTNPLSIFVAALAVVTVPDLARASKSGDEKTVFGKFVKLAVAYAVLLCAVSPLIVIAYTGFLGSSYAGMGPLIYAMVFGSALSAVSQAYQSRLLAAGRPVPASIVVIIGTAVGILVLVVAGLRSGGECLWLAPPIAQTIILIGMRSSVRSFVDRRSADARDDSRSAPGMMP